MPSLTITAADGRSFQHPLDKDVITIGRSSRNDLNLSFDLSLSRFHAEVLRQGNKWAVRDVGSRNGTSVNGAPVHDPITLKSGDRISLGETTILFGEDRSPAVVIEDAPASRPTTTFSLAIDDIITKSNVRLAGTRTQVIDVKELAKPGPSGAPDVESRTFAVLTRAGMELINHRPHEEVLDVIMDLIFEAIPAERGFLMLLEGEGKEMVSKAVRDISKSSGGAISLSRGIANMVVQNRQSILTQDAQTDERFRMHDSIVMQGIRSAMCVPLWNNKNVIGLVYVDTVATLAPFRPEDLKLLTLLANIAAVKIENAKLIEESIVRERLEKELEQAADIQKRLLPGDPPDLPGWELSGRADACRAVGGDYFDHVGRPGGCIGIVIGDVSGKGMAAALLMASVQAVFRTLSDVETSPPELLSSLNRHLLRSANPNKFVSFFFGELDPATGLLRYVNAGHNPPILLRRTEEVDRLPACGVVLGVFAQAVFAERAVTLEPGDILILFSDGITECQNLQGDEYGEDRLLEAVRKHRGRPILEIEKAVFDELKEFAGEAPQYDDATLVILRRRG